MEYYQQNTPTLDPQLDAWTSQANSKLMGWEGGTVYDAYGNPQIGFGQTPLQNYQMGNPYPYQNLANTPTNTQNTPTSQYGNAPTNVTHAGDNPYAPTTQGGYISGWPNYNVNWGATYNPAGMTQPGAGSSFTNQYAPWPTDYNAGTPASYPNYVTPSGFAPMANGNPVTFNPMSMGNPGNQIIPIPTAADLMKAYPMLTPELAATAVKQLQANPASPSTSRPLALNPYNTAATHGLTPSGSSIQPVTSDVQKIIAGLPRNSTPAQIAAALKGTSLGPQGDVASTTAAYNALDAAYRRNPNDPFIKQQLILAGDAMNTALYGPLHAQVRMAATSPANAIQMLMGLINVPNTAPKPLTYQERLDQLYGYGTPIGARRTVMSPGTGQRVQNVLKSAGWDPTSRDYSPRVWKYPDGKVMPDKQQAMLNDMLTNSAPNHGRPAPTSAQVAAARKAAASNARTAPLYTANGLPPPRLPGTSSADPVGHMPGFPTFTAAGYHILPGSTGWSADPAYQKAMYGGQRDGGGGASAPTPAPAAPASPADEIANWFRYNLPAWGTGNAQNTTLQALLGLI